MFGIDDIISGIFKPVLDKIVPDANARLELQKAHDAEVAAVQQQTATIEAAKYQAEMDLLKKQVDVNLAEASSKNLFIAGARPFAMWALSVAIVIFPVAMLLMVYLGKNIGDFFGVYTSLMAFLGGLFGVHTVERHRGVAQEQSPSASTVSALAQKVAGKFLRA